MPTWLGMFWPVINPPAKRLTKRPKAKRPRGKKRR